MSIRQRLVRIARTAACGILLALPAFIGACTGASDPHATTSPAYRTSQLPTGTHERTPRVSRNNHNPPAARNSKTRTPPPIASINLSLEDSWETRPLETLVAFIDARIAEGYEHIQLARPLPREHPDWGPTFEPINQWDILSRAHQLALETVVDRYPNVTFYTHLGYDFVRRDSRNASITRSHGTWNRPAYRQEIEEQLIGWKARGYMPFVEGMNVRDRGGVAFADEFEARHGWRPLSVIWQLDSLGAGRIVKHQTCGAMGELMFLANRANEGKLDPSLLTTDAPLWIAVSQASSPLMETPLFDQLMRIEGVGIMALNGGPKTMKLYKRAIDIQRQYE